MNIGNILWELFSLLCQGSLAGLIVLFFSEWFQRRRRKSNFKIYCACMSVEMENHLTYWNSLLQNNYISLEDIETLKDNSIFNKDLESIRFMKPKHIYRIHTYFFHCFRFFNSPNAKNYSSIALESMMLQARQVQAIFILYNPSSSTEHDNALELIISLENQIDGLHYRAKSRFFFQ